MPALHLLCHPIRWHPHVIHFHACVSHKQTGCIDAHSSRLLDHVGITMAAKVTCAVCLTPPPSPWFISTPITLDLTEPIDVYTDWIDECEAINAMAGAAEEAKNDEQFIDNQEIAEG